MPFRFHSTEGLELCQQILKEIAPNSDTHDWQLDIITRLLDQQDVLAITATGSGKTEMFIRLMHLIKVLSMHSVGKGDARFPDDPAMIVICPTKALEEEMESRMRTAGLTAVAINCDRVSMAQNAGLPDLYEQVRTGVSVLLISPEQLTSPRFKATIDSPAFKTRVCMMAVDEAHLMNTWGSTFRKDYQETGWMRARLPKNVPMIAVTATLQAGPPTQTVLDFLGFRDGFYHVLRRSNMRHDFRIVFRTCCSGIGSSSFPELDWVFTSPLRKVLIFCETINLSDRVNDYLFDHIALQALDAQQRAKRVRMFNALNWKDYNDETLALWKSNDPDVQIIVATSILSVGIDAPSFDDVIIFGEPDDVDEYWQELGRLRPNRSSSYLDGDSIGPRGILYLTQRAEETARKVLAAHDQIQTPREGTKQAFPSSMTRAMAELILAKCKVAALDKIYDNPSSDPPCPCTFCARHPVFSRPTTCRCTGCQPEEVAVVTTQQSKPAVSLKAKEGKQRGITRAMRATATTHLQTWRFNVFRSLDVHKYGYLPPFALLPDDRIKLLLDQIHEIHTIEDIHVIIADIPFTHDLAEDLYGQIQDLLSLFDEMKAKKSEERRALQVLRSREKESLAAKDFDSDSESEPLYESPPIIPTIRLRINPL